jgi:preprotein translocase subunit SecE
MSKATSGSGAARPGSSPSRPTQSSKPTQRAAQRTAEAARIQNFFEGLVSEMRRVTWPTRPEWVSATILTIVLVAGVSLFTYVCDVAFGYIFGLAHH